MKTDKPFTGLDPYELARRVLQIARQGEPLLQMDSAAELHKSEPTNDEVILFIRLWKMLAEHGLTPARVFEILTEELQKR